MTSHNLFCRFKSWKQFPKLKKFTWLFPINIISVWICPNFPNLSAALIEMTKCFCLLTNLLDILLLPWEEKIWELNCRNQVWWLSCYLVDGIKELEIVVEHFQSSRSNDKFIQIYFKTKQKRSRINVEDDA